MPQSNLPEISLHTYGARQRGCPGESDSRHLSSQLHPALNTRSRTRTDSPVWHFEAGRIRISPGNIALSYFLGSGHLGTTYLYELNHYLFESPVAWYAASHGYDMKPGLAEMTQMPPSLPMQSSCLRCHMSAVQRSDPGTINRYSGQPFLHGGITCEACHGDAQRHVNSGGKAAIVNPAHLDPERRDSVCISCHLEGDVSVERAGHSAHRLSARRLYLRLSRLLCLLRE